MSEAKELIAMLPAAPTHSGADYDQSYCWVMQIAGGQIKRGTAYLDTALIDRVTAHTAPNTL